ncbi:hypothetical protein GPJ56_006528 [Histomonas meleagridis]|uniref:uncharacterized protein n=1 Tax=Histomonas meleagridis TaxID=135588 RepID=UPI00355A95A4|nr:hypothetical protein GPJ56_006528 [Histomonas meleagridis]KAH0801765.1 hypothetical protein GO595_005446 [Histomonas meleagridis]
MEGFEVYTPPTPPLNSGSLLKLQFDPRLHVSSSDVFAYVEDGLKVEVFDIQLIKNYSLQTTGSVFVHTIQPVKKVQVRRLRNMTFNNLPVEIHLFKNYEEYIESFSLVSKQKISELSFPPSEEESIVFVKNPQSSKILKQITKFPNFLKAEKFDRNGQEIHALTFENSNSAFRAARLIKKKFSVVAGAIVVRDSRHDLMIKRAFSPNQIIARANSYGTIDKTKLIDNTLYIRYHDLLDAQIACALIPCELSPCTFTIFSDF